MHDEKAVDAITQEFLNSIDVAFDYKGDNYDDFGCQPLNIIFVRTGGTEGVFQKIFPQLQDKCQHPFYLLASDKSNSLAASMEILSYLRQRNMKGEIIHGSPEYISQRLRLLQQTATARHKLNGCRLGVIGRPSDWLISSYADYDAVNRLMGIQLIDIPISEVKDTVRSSTSDVIADSLPVGLKSEPSAVIRQALPGANQIYEALKTLIGKYNLQGFTLRCFDLLETLHNTGCIALARLPP